MPSVSIIIDPFVESSKFLGILILILFIAKESTYIDLLFDMLLDIVVEHFVLVEFKVLKC